MGGWETNSHSWDPRNGNSRIILNLILFSKQFNDGQFCLYHGLFISSRAWLWPVWEALSSPTRHGSVIRMMNNADPGPPDSWLCQIQLLQVFTPRSLPLPAHASPRVPRPDILILGKCLVSLSWISPRPPLSAHTHLTVSVQAPPPPWSSLCRCLCLPSSPLTRASGLAQGVRRVTSSPLAPPSQVTALPWPPDPALLAT